MTTSPKGFGLSLTQDGKIANRNKLASMGIPADLLDGIETKLSANLEQLKSKMEIDPNSLESSKKPMFIPEVQVKSVTAVVRSPEQQEHLRASAHRPEALAVLEARLVGVGCDLHMLLPDGSHVFYGNPADGGFKLFLGDDYQNITGAVAEEGTHFIWYTAKGTEPDLAVAQFNVLRDFQLNGKMLKPGRPQFLNVPDGEDEWTPAKATLLTVAK